MKNPIVTAKISEAQLIALEERFQASKEPNDNEYVVFFARVGDLVITAFKNKKPQIYKVTFVGTGALKAAQEWDENAKVSAKKKDPSKAHWLILNDQIGSDEVGTGDFFGPICVAAAYVKADQIARLRSLGVDDSKRLTDEDIKRLGAILVKEVEYSQISVDDKKFNELFDQGINMNEMKAKLHNQVLLNLRQKHPNVPTFVDQFTPAAKYYDYLEGSKTVIKDITFKTKGETYFPCVAVASIIARYSFLQKMENLAKKYKISAIPFGASAKVNKFARLFLDKYGEEELSKIVKKNFANYREVIS